MKLINALIATGTLTLTAGALPTGVAAADFGPANPFYAPSKLPFSAPPFDRIKDEDYQPAIEAGMAQQLTEIKRIAGISAPPTFENTFVAMEKSGRLLERASDAFDGVSAANTSPILQSAKTALAAKRAAHADAIHLNPKLFERVAAIYDRRNMLKLDPESLRLVEVTYDEFVHFGAKLSDADKAQLAKLNEEASTLSNEFSLKLLEATKDAAFVTPVRAALEGLSESQLSAASQAALDRKTEGYLIPLQNTTQQPVLASVTDRSTREAIFQKSWSRAERGDANDTRTIITRLAQIRAQRAKLLGYSSHAEWQLQDQMAKTPKRRSN